MHVQFVTNENGKATAVQIPMKEWEEIQKGLKKLELFRELKQAFNEMAEYESGKLKTPTTKQLLSQL